MIFPIGDDNIKGKVKPIFSYSLIVLNIAIFFLFQYGLSQQTEIAFYQKYAANPCDIMQGREFYTLVTSMFLHGGMMHLFGNMLFLWIFGDNIETAVGNFRYLLFYLAGGVFAAVVNILFDNTNHCIPMVGASGAISALIGAYLVMFPRSRIKMLFILYLKPFYIPAYVFIIFWIFQQFTGLLQAGGNVAYWAHIGGLVFGVISGLYFRFRYPLIKSFPVSRSKTMYKTMKQPSRRFNNRYRNFN